MTHSLTLGNLLLTRTFPDETHGFEFNVLAEGLGFGVAAGVKQIITSLLADGDLVRIDRYGNREVTFAVEITGPSLSALAHGEAALRREVGRPNTLTWQAPDVLSVPTVFEVVSSEMAQRFDDLDEALRRKRTFTVTLTCSPWARSANPSTVTPLPPPPVTPTILSVTNADTVTGWNATANTGSGSAAVTVVDEGASVRATSTSCFSLTLGYTPAAPLALTGSTYLLVETPTTVTRFYVLYTGDSAVTWIAPSMSRLLSSGNVQHALAIDGTRTLSYIGLQWSSAEAGVPGPTYASLAVADISRTDTLPQISKRQSSRTIEVGGTERTPGSLRIAAPNGSSALNLTLVATWPENGSGFSPPLRRWRTGGNAITTDANTFSGSRETLGTSYVQCDVPISSLPPGTYQLMALMRSSVVGPFTVEASIQSRMNGVTLGETPWSEVVNFPIANDWKLVPMGVYSVPIVAQKAGEFRIIFRTPSVTTAEYDEAWLFPVDDDCALTSVLVSEPNLWLDSPNVGSPVPHVLEGTAANKSDAHWPRYGIHTMGNHIFSTPRTSVFTATFGVDNPDVTLTYHKRWHSNAAED